MEKEVKEFIEIAKTFPGAKERYENSEMCGLSWGELRELFRIWNRRQAEKE